MNLPGNIIRTCRVCGRPISTAEALAYRLGADHRREATPEELEYHRKLTLQESDPFYVPPEQGPSLQARANNRNAQAAARGGVQLCARHASPVGACAMCRLENDPKRAADRILREIRKMTREERRFERVAAQEGRYERAVIARRARPQPAPKPEPEAEPEPKRPPKPRRPPAPPAGQMTFC